MLVIVVMEQKEEDNTKAKTQQAHPIGTVEKLEPVSPDSEAVRHHREQVQRVLRPLIREQEMREIRSYELARTRILRTLSTRERG